MKWTNKGHEFDNMAKSICNEENCYYIWGAGVAGKRFYQCIKNESVKIIGFIDNNPQISVCETLPVFRPEVLTEDKVSKVLIATLDYVAQIEEYLLESGKKLNEDFFYVNTFLEIYMMYMHGKLYSHHLNVHITDKCSYKCKKCSVYIPYIECPININIENIKKGVDYYFSLVDYVTELHLIGGEPMVHPDLENLVDYIGNHYRDQIGEFAIATNGTVMPTDGLCDVCRQHNVFLTISDYSYSPMFTRKNRVSEIVKKLEEKKVEYRLGNKNQWFEFEPEKVDCFTDEELNMKFTTCFFRNRVLRDDKLFYCHHEAGAVWAGKEEETADSALCLFATTKEELMEFDMGCNSRGFLAKCARCNGYERLNHYFIDAAEQL